ncbi:NAD(P)H-dependent oxidoreductase [Roseibium salinum]|uniref:NAD(P)H-dependent oxidoreductase n=1 Tax=Roseibium salinum TaxID=1604349 RepID=A0ABT3R7Q8_9HYPH|nr:NAD(P)H-dependent oxidoreductase [Roseibium sp. DSM 29163]MCX2725346.1 NAD(P)H-dependent oxidoreductase [Roseibium sp. DSM 29163]MDN3720815.1 NAD(P)H-dependent oxidoreductase [Roseibium salinum]
MKSILILDGHPDPDERHLGHALSAAYQQGALAAGHEATLVRIADLEFPVLRKPSDFSKEPTPNVLQPARDALLAADHLVLVYPLWLGTLPAYTKAFLEQLLHYDTAFERAADDRWPKGKMRGKSARVVVTMGMPALAYTLWYRAHSLKNLKRNILGFAGFKPVRSTLFGMVEQAGEARVSKWLKKMEALGRDAA